jgi:hypothetical protein
MKKMKLVLLVAFMLGSYSAFSQKGVDTVDTYNKGINQNPSMNDNQNINNNQNNSNQSPTYDYNMDKTSPGQNAPSDYKLNKEDSVTLYKKGGTLINTDSSSSKYPANGPSNRSYGGSQTAPQQ